VSVLAEVERARALPRAEREAALPRLYLLFEQYLVEVDPLPRFDRAALRERVRAQHAALTALPQLELIFQPTHAQRVSLCKALLGGLLRRVFALLGGTGDNSLAAAVAWLETVPGASTLPVPLGLPNEAPGDEREWVDLLRRLARRLFERLEGALGEQVAGRVFRGAFRELADSYAGLDTFGVVVELLPDRLLDAEMIGLFSRAQIQLVLLEKVEELDRAKADLETRVLERTAELRSANEQLMAEIARRSQSEAALRESEVQLQQAQKMEAVGRLAGGVAHDFNNLLTIVTGFSELLLSRMGAADAERHYVEQIAKAGERATALTGQLLAFSRQQVLEPTLVDLNEAVASTEQMLGRLIGEDVDLATVLEPSLGRVRADRGQVGQVILNLAVNARDAMPRGGKLLIATRNAELAAPVAGTSGTVPPGRYALLEVSDTGTGMDAATQARIFDPFFTTKERGKGTGLGLSTVYGIVAQSGGHIRVDSAPGRGTTFRIYLPRVAAEDEERAAEQVGGGEPGAPLGDETILLVEDEEDVRQLVQHVLRTSGYRVLAASGGEQALEVARGHDAPIDLLLTDVVMPGLSGPDLAERLRAVRPQAAVLFMSGYTDHPAVHQAAAGAGGEGFLPKPFKPDVLARTVRERLDARTVG
jgi:signal transduction histidine kinase/ActR/RegA family two-component response regulator